MPPTFSFSSVPENSMYSFIHLFKKFLLSTYCVPSIELEAADNVVNINRHGPTLISSIVGKIDVNQISI